MKLYRANRLEDFAGLGVLESQEIIGDIVKLNWQLKMISNTVIAKMQPSRYFSNTLILYEALKHSKVIDIENLSARDPLVKAFYQVLGVNGDIIANDRLISSFMHDWKTGFTLSLGEAYTAECIQSLKGSQWERQVMDSTEWAMQQ